MSMNQRFSPHINLFKASVAFRLIPHVFSMSQKLKSCISQNICMASFNQCLFMRYIFPLRSRTPFNGDKSPLLGAFCINSVGVIVTVILCISHIAFKCCIKHQVNDIQGVPEKKRAPFSNFGFTSLCDNYGPWTPRRFCYFDLCTYLILSMYDEIKWPTIPCILAIK